MSEFNSAISYNMKNAITGIYPNYRVEPSLLLLSRGDLPNAPQAAANCNLAGELKFDWSNNSGTGKAEEVDNSVLIAYSPYWEKVIYTLQGSQRSTGKATLNVSNFSGLKVETFLSFLAADGTIANSVYTGQVEIL
jgi:hypothetical protein